jgi:hypothetical protein
MADRGGSQKSTLLGPQLLTPSSSPSRWHVLPSHAPIICSSPFVPGPSDHAPPSYERRLRVGDPFLSVVGGRLHVCRRIDDVRQRICFVWVENQARACAIPNRKSGPLLARLKKCSEDGRCAPECLSDTAHLRIIGLKTFHRSTLLWNLHPGNAASVSAFTYGDEYGGREAAAGKRPVARERR